MTLATSTAIIGQEFRLVIRQIVSVEREWLILKVDKPVNFLFCGGETGLDMVVD
jgi:hypothetical protein